MSNTAAAKIVLLLAASFIAFSAIPLTAQSVEVEFESVTVEPGDETYFRILLNTNVPISGLRVPVLLPTPDIIIDSVSFRYSVAQELLLYSRFNNNNRRDFILALPDVGQPTIGTIDPFGGEICRVHFKVDEFASAGVVPIDTFINTIYVGDIRIDEQLEASDELGNQILPDIDLGEIRVDNLTDVDDDSNDSENQPVALPETFTLRQNFPNPFNPTTRIRFSVPYSSEVSLVVYDGIGREVEVLGEGVFPPGVHSLEWNATEHPSGVYLYQLTTPEGTISRKMVVIK